MCTVSVVPRPGGFRLLCNRDERLTRPPAEPPQVRRAGRRVAVFPIDSRSGGTWVGVNDAGLGVAVLNRNASVVSPSVVGAPVSRGVVAPRLLACGSIEEACARLIDLDWHRYLPFRVLLVDGRRVAVVRLEGVKVCVHSRPLSAPVMLTSSSLGDDIVENARQAIFCELVLSTTDPFAGQAAFHRHQWADQPQISVRMRRADAATVSRTAIESTAHRIHVAYEATC